LEAIFGLAHVPIGDLLAQLALLPIELKNDGTCTIREIDVLFTGVRDRAFKLGLELV